eukprot:gene4311-1549_t
MSLSAHLKGGKQLLQAAPEWAKVTDRVISVLGLNPGTYTLTGTNTYLVGTGPSRILIDTGEGVEGYIDNLEAAMTSSGCTSLERVIITHWHHDHVGGVAGLKKKWPDLPVSKMVSWQAVAGDGGSRGHEECEHPGAEAGQSPTSTNAPGGERYEPMSDGDVFKTDGATLRAIHTPGHTPDHVALLLEEDQSLFTGDCILGIGTAVFEDLAAYMESLKIMHALNPSRLLCGHGPPVDDAVGKIDEYIVHRETRINQVAAVINGVPKGSALTAEDVTRKIYVGLAEHLIVPATGNTVLVLKKLAADGTAACIPAAAAGTAEGRWWCGVESQSGSASGSGSSTPSNL